MNKAERQHIAKVVEHGCIVCRNNGFPDTPAEAHHITGAGMAKRASHYEVLPLCPIHHRYGCMLQVDEDHIHTENCELGIHSDGKYEWEERYGTQEELLNQLREEL